MLLLLCWGCWAAVRLVAVTNIGAEGCKWLSEAVKENTTLTSLDVDGKCVCGGAHLGGKGKCVGRGVSCRLCFVRV